MTESTKVVALSGGIGGAKLALGLARVLPPGDLTILANTGDDFAHLGLAISPDLDTLMYTLAGLDNPDTGWGRRGETWTCMAALAALGGEAWFRLGDGDLATHIERTRRLADGETLTAITADFCRRLGIATHILPATDDRLRTRVRTRDGWIEFQDYFVRQQCAPEIVAIEFAGAERARPTAEVFAALRDPQLRAVVICPSNPLISVEPILAVAGLRRAIAACGAPVIAVSPLIAGRAVKGPTAKMMSELGLAPSAAAVARRYGDLLDAYVVDHADSAAVVEGVRIVPAHTLMRTLEDREALAKRVLAVAAEIGRKP